MKFMCGVNCNYLQLRLVKGISLLDVQTDGICNFWLMLEHVGSSEVVGDAGVFIEETFHVSCEYGVEDGFVSLV